MWRLGYSIPIWILFLSLRTVLILFGWVTVPIAALLYFYGWQMDQDGVGNARMEAHFTSRFMWLWDNQEDGIYNDTYWKAPNEFIQIVYWSCLRNPANNLRYVPYLSLKIDPKRVQWIGGPFIYPKFFDQKPPRPEWFFAWQGIYSNFFWQFNFRGEIYRAWIGWKIMPYDVNGVTDHREHSAGFATQFKRLT